MSNAELWNTNGAGEYFFTPLYELQDEFAFSGNRYLEYAAENHDIFTDRQLIWPEEGFESEEHQKRFVDNWHANRAAAHRIGRAGYAAASVYESFNYTDSPDGPLATKGNGKVAGVKQPFSGNRGPAFARQAFEKRWSGGARAGKYSLYKAAKSEVLKLDSQFIELAPEDQDQFLLDNPGYRYEPRRAKEQAFREARVEHYRKTGEWLSDFGV